MKYGTRFTRDPHEIEMFKTAENMLETRAGDCGSKVILLTSLLKSIGHNAKAVVIDTNRDGAFNHAVVLDYVNGRVVFMELVTDRFAFGEIPPHSKKIVF